MKESTLKNKVLKYLNGLPGCKAIKQHGNVFSEEGTPDISGCMNGRAFWIELKVPGEEPTVIQQKRIKEWQETGAISGYATSIDEVTKLIKDIM